MSIIYEFLTQWLDTTQGPKKQTQHRAQIIYDFINEKTEIQSLWFGTETLKSEGCKKPKIISISTTNLFFNNFEKR